MGVQQVEPVMNNDVCNKGVLESILRRWMKELNSLIIEEVNVEPACHKGNNFVSRAWRLKIKGHLTESEGKQIPYESSIIAKAKPEDECQNAMMNADVAFKNEKVSYEELIPLLNEYLCEGDEPIKCPKYIYGDKYTVLLEDMTCSNFHNRPKLTNLDLPAVQSIIREIAKIHATSLVAQSKNESKFNASISKLKEVLYRTPSSMEEKQKATIDTVLALIEEEIAEPELDKFKTKLKHLKETIWVRGVELVEKKSSIRVINHSDIWINNIMFSEKEIVLLDWQNVRFASPALDLSYFLHISLEPKFRLEHYKDILNYYLENLRRIINEKIPGHLEKELNIEWLLNEMKDAEFLGYMMSIWIMPVFYWTDEEFDYLASKGGLENLPIEERLDFLKPEEKKRMVELTKIYVNGSI